MLVSKRSGRADRLFFVLLIGWSECREQLPVLAPVERHNDNQRSRLGPSPAAMDVLYHQCSDMYANH
ncbi:hypothetical protein ASD64_07940 [Mesorhizobium sp. Root157]|nr:hypothetical protein ASD64_07940 [Mesorhizobium sp. Root157]